MKILLRRGLRLLATVLYRVKIVGDVKTFNQPRLLIVANHESFLDGLLLGLFLPIDPVFVVHTGVTRFWYFRIFLAQVNYLAVDPTSPMAMKQVIRLLESGRPVVIFPEGRISVTGSLMKVYDGPAFVAAKADATIVPVHLDGTVHTYFARVSGKSPRRLFPQISITILPATRLTMPQAATARLRRRKTGEALRHVMQNMIFASRPQQSLYSAFCDAIEIHGRRHRLVEDPKQIEYSYHDLLKMTLLLTRLTQRAAPEVCAGDRIGLLLPNMASTLTLIIGLGARRLVPAMLNYTAGADGIQNACIAATIKVIVTSREFIMQAKLTDKVAAISHVRLIYLEDIYAAARPWDKLWLFGFALLFPRTFEDHVLPEDAAVVLFTSGSEGKPKGVVLPHRALLANIAQIHSVIDFSADDKVLNTLPIFHSFSLTAGSLLPLLSGAGLFLYPSPLHYRIIPELAYDRACTILFGTSTFLANYGKFANPYDFYRMRYIIAGAEPLAEEVRQLWFEKFGLRIYEGYGATETSPVLAVNTPMAYRTGTVGQLLPGIEFQLVPFTDIEHGKVLHVRGANVMSGYLKVEQPGVLEPPRSSLGEGWYETGDLVEIDEDDFLHILGRSKRFAKIAGEMVSLESVEHIATAASPDSMHAVSIVPDPRKGEALVLFTTDESLSPEALLAAAHKLGRPELAVPRKIVVVQKMPLLGSGKVDYPKLAQIAESA